MRVSPGMVLLMVGREPPTGVASIRKPVMVSILVRQCRVNDVSFASVMRTRRGGLTSALRRREKTGVKHRAVDNGW